MTIIFSHFPLVIKIILIKNIRVSYQKEKPKQREVNVKEAAVCSFFSNILFKSRNYFAAKTLRGCVLVYPFVLCVQKRIDLHPAFLLFAPIIDIALDENNPLIAMCVVLKEVELRKALN